MIVYVELLNEGTLFYRPVEADKNPDGSYTLSLSQPESEEWEFPPGSTVECEWRQQREDNLLLAIRELPPQTPL